MEMVHSFMNITSIFLFLLLPLLLVVVLFITKREKRLPPGPWKLPLIGNLHQLAGQQQIHVALKELAGKYGPLMHLKLGERSVIVITSYQMLKDVTKISHTAFGNRPDMVLSQTISYDKGDIAFAPYGDYWRKMRKICTLQLLSPKRVQSFYPLMEEEISSHLATYINNSNNTSINLTKFIHSLACAIICRTSVGMACEDPKSLIRASHEISTLAGVFNISDLFPSLKFLDFITGSKQKLRKAHVECDRLLDDIVTAHEETTINNNDQEDLLHVLLRIRDEEAHNLNIPITRDSIKAVLTDVFLGGSDTTKVAVEWAMSELLKNPAIMKKVQAEVRENLKGKKIVEHSDIQNLKYLKLVINETLRLHPGPLGFPRESAEQYEFNGYIIPNKTIAIANLWAMGRDPQYWHDPEKFEPERFNVVDNTKGIPFETIPFGYGLRACPGMTFGLTTVELILARLLFHFDWKLPNGMNFEELDMTDILGVRKNNLYAIAEAPQLSN